ncbi:rRNA-processing protein CGR1 [Chaetomium tenue]|uniref:rRNA-processing protein CGR1 n=1 Tax=Chaetomium tenue TaxID=1854479 RepID=A0ACB7PTG9_9PEZI|nr:rRNA-processing protein CGR1 [Chaetomium globosum]
MSTTIVDGAQAPEAAVTKPLGMRKNGKQWHAPKKAFRPGSGLTSYEQRAKTRVAQAATKAKEKELKEEKEAERKRRMQALVEKRTAKAEKERYELLAAKMHKKRLERLKRKEKRNKVLNS